MDITCAPGPSLSALDYSLYEIEILGRELWLKTEDKAIH